MSQDLRKAETIRELSQKGIQLSPQDKREFLEGWDDGYSHTTPQTTDDRVTMYRLGYMNGSISRLEQEIEDVSS